MSPVLIHSVTVDGVNLSQLAWNISSYSGMRRLPPVRSSSVVVPGRHGEIPGTFEDFEVQEQSIKMWVAGSDPQGKVPRDPTRVAELHDNLDQLFTLFGKRHGLLDLRMTVGTSNIRQADAQVVATIAPDIFEAGVAAEFTVLFQLPYVFWRDVATSDWTRTAPVSGTAYEVTTLVGSTGPVTDPIVLVTGPATNPMVKDDTTGSWVRYDGTLTSSQQWRVNTSTFESVIGTGISWTGAGTSVIAQTSNGGPSSATRLLMLVSKMQGTDPSDRRVKVSLTGTGFTSGTNLQIRARRAFL